MTALLGIPLGAKGSGRQRYGVAMAMYQRGHLGPEQLEGYRIAAASDTAPPDPVLADRHLPLPAPIAAIRHLREQAEAYITALPGPGIAKVDAALQRFRDSHLHLPEPQGNPVVTAHLPSALAALAVTHTTLAAAIGLAAPHLRWITYDAYDPALIGAGFAGGHAYASIVGQDSPFVAHDIDLGLFVIAPHVLYRDHHHLASELYAPLTGPHGWRFGAGTPLVVQPAHQPVWNPPNRPHLTKVGPVPFLCLFCWTENVNATARVIPADDWPALEALRLDP